MKNLGKIVGTNLLILLAYSLLIRFTASAEQRSLGIMIESAFAVGLHVFISLIIGLISYSTNKDLGKAWLLTTGIVLLVGFSTCLGNASL